MTASAAGRAPRGSRRSSRRGQWGVRDLPARSGGRGEVLTLGGRGMAVFLAADSPVPARQDQDIAWLFRLLRLRLGAVDSPLRAPHNPALPTASRSPQGDLYDVERGGVSRAAKGADCKSAV